MPEKEDLQGEETPFQRFQAAVKKIVSTPKKEVEKRLKDEKLARTSERDP